MLEQALTALKAYDWGQDPKTLSPIDEAIVASHGDAAKRRELEDQLVAVLTTADATYDGKQTACRYLMAIGSAACVPALAALLPDEKISHMGRYALERNRAPEAAAALRDALPKVSGKLKIGMISSLGDRGDDASVTALGELIGEGDAAVASAAALALGAIRTPAAAEALSKASPSAEVQPAVTDASLACAEALLAAGKKIDALKIYKKYAGESQPKHVRLAATRGMLACAGKQE
jgi:HEAT repeat protein